MKGKPICIDMWNGKTELKTKVQVHTNGSMRIKQLYKGCGDIFDFSPEEAKELYKALGEVFEDA